MSKASRIAPQTGIAPRIDSHQHFWQLSRGDYHWLGQESQVINRDFLPAHLQPLLAGAGVDKTVIVQAAETVAETDFILDLADKHDFVAGVVGWVDMNKGESIQTIERFSESSKFLGIRPVIQGIADPDWMLKSELDPIFSHLIDNDLSFDALVKPIHLDNLATLLARYPELRVVIDHGAKPNIAEGLYSPWAEKMAQIADESSAFCKFSGLVTEAGAAPSYEKLEPYMTQLARCFGTDRLMWGSDWPVCTLASPYQTWLEDTLLFLESFTPDEQDSILGLCAQKFYKLKI